MQGDFSVLNFDPTQHERGVDVPAKGLLRNLSGVLHQQGRVTTDADFTEGELLDLGWQGQAARDVIGEGVCAVPATQPEGFRVEAAAVVSGQVRLKLRPGRAWADGILTRLVGTAANPTALVERSATYFGPPIANPLPDVTQINDTTRDAVILEVSEEALHGFQYPERLIEPALGGPDTTERAFVNFRLRLLRLANGEDCTTIRDKLRDTPLGKGRLTASLAPVVAIAGDCPVVGGGGYTGFEHNLYRIEIADTPSGSPARFKWSQWNGGLVGRGRIDVSTDPDRLIIDAGRTAIVNSGLTSFYLEVLQYDALLGAWTVTYGTTATLNTDHDLELAGPPAFGAVPTTPTVFFRLWNGIADVSAFTNAANPVELRDGIRLAFDAPVAGSYRSGDYWTFSVRAGEISNPQVLLDHAPPVGVIYHRVPLAEIHWTARRDTSISGSIEDCRKRFRPLTNQKICCTLLVGDGVRSFGDFNSLEEAAAHLPAAGGELCLLPGLHRANLRLQGRSNITIHGCSRRTLLLPRTETRLQPILHIVDCVGVRIYDLDMITLDGIGVLIEGPDGKCRDVHVRDTRMIARLHCIRANDAAELYIANNRLHLLDTVTGLTTVSLAADDSLVERNTLVLLPFVDPTPNDPEIPDDDPTRDPADPCAKPDVLYAVPQYLQAYAVNVWTFVLASLAPVQPYRAIGGIHLRAGCDRVRLLENQIVGGGGNGITLGGDLDPQPVATATGGDNPSTVPAAKGEQQFPVDVNESSQFLGFVQDETGAPQANIDVYLEAADASVATDRSDSSGLVAIKAKAGRYLLDVSPEFQILKVSPAATAGVVATAIIIAPRRDVPDRAKAFLHEIAIEANDVSMMGLSGIGFATRTGTALPTSTVNVSTNNAKASLIAFGDAALLNFALSPLLRATHLMRDLVILNNRLHHNLRNPFTEPLLAQAQQIGRGGISLPVVESAAIRGNQIHDNGVTAINPTCGLFIGYGNDIAITDNALTGNGAITADYEENRRAGIRGGIYVRFAGALVAKFATSSGRKPALQVHDNRVDQPAGRALTAFAFGPLSIANNHFSSDFTGRFGFLDTAFGAVLVLNLGGMHRVIARIAGGKIDNDKVYVARAETALPGGETLFNDNFVRLDAVNRSITAQGIFCLDDLSYASNTSSVYRSDPFFCNTVLIADTLRATGGRLREEASRTLSLLTRSLRGNMTALNQADHCIFAFPTNQVPATVAAPNHIFDPQLCLTAGGAMTSVGVFAAPALSANAAQLGGTLEANAFSEAEINTLGRNYTATSLAQVSTTQVAVNRAYQQEAVRTRVKLGAQHPRTQALNAYVESGVTAQRLLATSAEATSTTRPTTPDAGAAISGRLVNSRGQGQAGYNVELVRTTGAAAAGIGRTDLNGAFAATFDSKETEPLVRFGKLQLRVLDAKGNEVLLSKETVTFTVGANLEITLTLPLRAATLNLDRSSGTVTTGTTTTTTTTTPTRTSTTGSTRTRTSLDKLQLDDTTRKQLQSAGIVDVEGIVETDSRKLTEIVGADAAKRLIEAAKKVLG